MNWMEVMQAFTGGGLKNIEMLWIKTKPWQGVLFEREKKYKKTTEWAMSIYLQIYQVQDELPFSPHNPPEKKER